MPFMSSVAERVPDRAFATAIAYAHRRFEPVLGQVRMFVSPKQTAIDVGAWFGPWTHWLATVAREVVTVEANPELADFVSRTTPSNVRVVAAAASNSVGTAELWLPAGGKGTEGRASLSPQGAGRTIKVETIRLDDLEVSDLGMIKVDVEGHELEVLQGAEGLVRRWQPTLVVEIEDSRAPAAATLELLADWGYEGSYYAAGAWHLLEGFDLVAHQKRMERTAHHGYLRAVLDGSGTAYVNTVVFRPRRPRVWA